MQNLIEFLPNPIIEFYTPQVIEFLPTTAIQFLPIPFIQFVPEEFRYININNHIIYGYSISNYGIIYSNKTNMIMKQHVDKYGYNRISLNIGGRKHSLLISRLVLQTFKPISNPELYQANHKNGIKSINGLWNLEWTTPKENTHHAIRTGLMPNNLGENNYGTNFTDKDVHKICNYMEQGFGYNKICNIMNIGEKDRKKFKGLLYNISGMDTWKHISNQYQIKNRKQDNQILTEKEVHQICKLLKQNMKYIEIIKSLGLDYDSLNKKRKGNFYTCIAKIKNKVRFKHISDLYF